MSVPTSDELRHRVRNLYPSLIKLRPLRHRHFDGVLASMQQSGTQWVVFMLGLTLARLYDLPRPRHLHDNSIIGSPIYPQIPQILHTHAIPHYLFRSRTVIRLLRFPKYVILVRDLRDVLVSHYEKHKSEYNADFSTYLHGNVRGGGRRKGGDIWVRIRFLNGWGAVAERHPREFAVLKYEDLVADTRGEFARVCDHFEIEGVTLDLVDTVVGAASKSKMRNLPDPKGKWIVIRTDSRPSDEWYSDADRRFVAEVCRRNLKYTFGYRYW